MENSAAGSSQPAPSFDSETTQFVKRLSTHFAKRSSKTTTSQLLSLKDGGFLKGGDENDVVLSVVKCLVLPLL